MKLERSDWMVADNELKESANRWWVPALIGAGLEAALLASLWEGSRLGGPWGMAFSALLAARVICGCIGAWSWATSTSEPSFWSYRAKWIMQFLPGALLSSSRQKAARKFLKKLVDDIDGRIDLAAEQEAYYAKGAGKAELGHVRLEMACWASALRECKGRWTAQREQELMKSASARSRALEELGMGKGDIEKSLHSLERLEISASSRDSAPAERRQRL